MRDRVSPLLCAPADAATAKNSERRLRADQRQNITIRPDATLRYTTMLLPMPSRSAVKILLGFVLGLPVVLVVLHWVSGLLSAMADASAAAVLGHIGTGIGVLWIVSVVGLIVALAVEVLDDGGDGQSGR